MELGFMAATTVAKDAHEGQVRKYTNEPYLSHPFAVAGLVASVTSDDDMIIAALLHDVVEDSEVGIDKIFGLFGRRVGSMVSDLTDISKPEDGNRKHRKRVDLLHTKAATPEAKTIKLADLIDNSKTIVQLDPDFAKVYMEEKRKLLEVLTEGNEKLFKIANDIVADYYLTTPQPTV